MKILTLFRFVVALTLILTGTHASAVYKDNAPGLDSSRCIVINPQTNSDIFGTVTNTCDFPINVVSCFEEDGGVVISLHRCPGKLEVFHIAANSTYEGGEFDRGEDPRVYIKACKAPSEPTGAVFIARKGIKASCPGEDEEDKDKHKEANNKHQQESDHSKYSTNASNDQSNTIANKKHREIDPSWEVRKTNEGCNILWLREQHDISDNFSWDGTCRDGFADGNGILYSHNTQAGSDGTWERPKFSFARGRMINGVMDGTVEYSYTMADNMTYHEGQANLSMYRTIEQFNDKRYIESAQMRMGCYLLPNFKNCRPAYGAQ